MEFQYTLYLSILAIPAVICICASISKLRRRTQVNMMRLKENDLEEFDNETERPRESVVTFLKEKDSEESDNKTEEPEASVMIRLNGKDPEVSDDEIEGAEASVVIRLNGKDPEVSDDETEGAEAVLIVPVPSWEISSQNLAIERIIGRGAFGVVSKAYLLDLANFPDWTVVAVKSLKEGATESERKDLLSELNLLKKLKPHPHVIRLLGYVTRGKENPYVIVEYVPYGDLLGYLRKSRGARDCYYEYPHIEPETTLTSKQILTFAWQIADGMRYISSKKIIHRDLAARNVLVGENHRCKITDFGMAHDADLEDSYIPSSQGRVPVKWTAIEVITGRMKYSTKSDVWSFGILLYEICTIGAEPYPEISPHDIPKKLLEGYRIPKPGYFKDELYDIMLNCWEMEPERRPSFKLLGSSIRGLQKCSNQNYVNIEDCLETYESSA